jgi:hypothetical protein
VIPVCGGPLADVVFAGSGLVYATNSSRNQVEVLSSSTGALEAPIPVGSQPRGLDLSADGTTLYVANSGGEDISVVDLALRREVRRITIPKDRPDDRPSSIAVAANGVALVATRPLGDGWISRMVEVELASGAVTELYQSNGGGSVEASGDRSRVVFVNGQGTNMAVYDAATGSLGLAVSLVPSPRTIAVDATGSRVILNPGTEVYDGALTRIAAIPGGGAGPVDLNSAGTTGYRVQGAGIEVLNLGKRVVDGTIELPAPAGPIALSPGETNIAIVTTHGLAIVPIRVTPTSVSAVWTQPTATALDAIATWMVPGNDPSAAVGQLPPTYLYSHWFGFTQSSTAVGVVGLVTHAGTKLAVLGISDTDGTAHSVGVPFDWVAGRFYYLLAAQLGPSSFGGWVYDHTTEELVYLGQIDLPSAVGKISPTSITAAAWYGSLGASCSAYPVADVYVHPPVGYANGTTTFATLADSGPGDTGNCPVSATTEIVPWLHLHLGAEMV